MSNYANQKTLLENEQEFPHGLCPVMSKMAVTIVPVAGPIHRPQPEMQPAVVFAAAPCVGKNCQLWNKGPEGGCSYAD